MPGKRRLAPALAAAVAIIAAAVGVTIFVTKSFPGSGSSPDNRKEDKDGNSGELSGSIPSELGGKLPKYVTALGKIVAVVDNPQQAIAVLQLSPTSVVVGTENVSLRAHVQPDSTGRVIETETASGWIHIIKHLRPDTALLGDGLDGTTLGRFVGKTISIKDVL